MIEQDHISGKLLNFRFTRGIRTLRTRHEQTKHKRSKRAHDAQAQLYDLFGVRALVGRATRGDLLLERWRRHHALGGCANRAGASENAESVSPAQQKRRNCLGDVEWGLESLSLLEQKEAPGQR